MRGWVGLIHGHLPISHRSHLVLHRGLRASSCKFSVYFARKNLLFLFYTFTFTKHPHQFIYSTHLFNKIFILFTFFYYFLPSPPLWNPLTDPTQTQNHPHPPTHQPTHPQSSTTITSQKIQTEIPNPTENPNKNSKPHKKSK